MVQKIKIKYKISRVLYRHFSCLVLFKVLRSILFKSKQKKMGFLETNTSNPISFSDEIVQRQLNRKRALENELHRDKYRLEIMQYDIRVFEMSFPLSETDRLTEEIKILQNECKMLSEMLDKAGVAVLGDLSSSVNGK